MFASLVKTYIQKYYLSFYYFLNYTVSYSACPNLSSYFLGLPKIKFGYCQNQIRVFVICCELQADPIHQVS